MLFNLVWVFFRCCCPSKDKTNFAIQFFEISYSISMINVLKLIERKEEKRNKQVDVQRKRNDQKKLIIDSSIQIGMQLELITNKKKRFESLPFYAIDN